MVLDGCSSPATQAPHHLRKAVHRLWHRQQRLFACFVQSAYALYLIKEGQFKEAYEMAKEVLNKCRPQDISITRDKDAHGLALQVIYAVPVEFRADGEKTQNTEEANLLAQAKENPRRYLRLGQLAEQRKELTRAIEYYGLFRRNFPTDETALNFGVKIGGIYEQQKQVDKAMETYESVWKSDPNAPQAVTARDLSVVMNWVVRDPSGIRKNEWWVDEESGSTALQAESLKGEVPNHSLTPDQKGTIRFKLPKAGAWYFHVIAEDTAGNRTAAACFPLRIDIQKADPRDLMVQIYYLTQPLMWRKKLPPLMANE